MNEISQIIPIQEKDGKQTIELRVLYNWLGLSKPHISSWIKNNIDENEFLIENQDYIGFTSSVNGNIVKDYYLTIETAKKISMMVKTEKGEKARQYFIECENKLKQVANQYQIPQSYPEALKLAYEQALKIEEQEKQITEDKPKVEFAEAVTGSRDAISVGEAAKVLNMGVGQNQLFEFLRDVGLLQKDNVPYQSFIDRGYFRVIESKYTKPNGEIKISLKTLVLQKGLDYIRKLLIKNELERGE